MRPDLDLAQKYLSISPAELDRAAIARGGLWTFVQRAWPVIETDPLVPGWHLEEMCTHLEAVSRGECKRLIINVPPGMSKSTIVSVLWPAWDWTLRPGRSWMVATFDDALMRRDALRLRRLVSSDWYQARWGDRVRIAHGDDYRKTQNVFETTAGGRRFSTTTRSDRATGWHADIQVVDDPTKPAETRGDPELARAALERTWQWWTGTMASRAKGSQFARVIIMQRLHELDLVGRILDQDHTREWTVLMLPMCYEPERRCRTPWGGDRRTEPGELLCPARFDAAAVAEKRREMTEQVAAAQLQQRPAPASGNLFRREWFAERWKVLPADMLLVQSWDCTFKDSSGADYVAGHVWGFSGGKYYLVDHVHDRMGLPETIRCLEAFARRHPKARAKLVEDKANGPAVEQMLRGKMPGILMVTPEGGKVARANAIAPLVEAHNVVLPDASVHPWSDEVLEELVTFPFSRHDDDVDAMTQALTYLHDRNPARYLDAMRRVASGQWRYAR